MDTIVISTIFLYFFKNSSSRMLFMCKMSFYSLFWSNLYFLWVVIYYHLVLGNPFITTVGIQNPTRIQQKSSF
jgi:hypothetical protein